MYSKVFCKLTEGELSCMLRPKLLPMDSGRIKCDEKCQLVSLGVGCGAWGVANIEQMPYVKLVLELARDLL